MAVRTKVRAGVRPKRPALPFVAPEEHCASKADVADLKTKLKTDIAKIETKIAQLEPKIVNLRTELKDTKAQIITWLAGLQLTRIDIIIAVLK